MWYVLRSFIKLPVILILSSCMYHQTFFPPENCNCKAGTTAYLLFVNYIIVWGILSITLPQLVLLLDFF